MFQFQVTFRLITLVIFVTLLIIAAVAAAAYLPFWEYARQIVGNVAGVEKTLIVAGVTQVCLYYADLYNLRRVSDRRELFIRMAQALGAAALILALIYYWFPDLVIGRGVFAIATAFIVVLVVGWRVAF